MLVKINKTHTENSEYSDGEDCPLYRAIKEQFPEFPLERVLGSHILDTEGNKYPFNSGMSILGHKDYKEKAREERVWAWSTMQDIKDGEIEELELFIKTETYPIAELV